MATPPGLAAYYDAPIDTFLRQSDEHVLGMLNRDGAMQAQVEAWKEELAILRNALIDVQGHLCLEFTVPRLGSRADAIVLLQSAIVVIEFKVGQKHFTRADTNQVWDYALDLKNFHAASHHLLIFPVLVATEASGGSRPFGQPSEDGVYPPAHCTVAEFPALMGSTAVLRDAPFDAKEWIAAPYRPTPTIIEAAKALYARHSVTAIARHDAGAKNLAQTSQAIDTLIDAAKRDGKKSVIFVTGVPGAGKTLVGLNVATQHSDPGSTHAVFLSGNGPLVAVLREALTRDELTRLRGTLPRPRKGAVQEKVKAFIQNVHHFRDAGLRNAAAPADHVAIFDEAQRAWNVSATANFMKRRKGVAHFSHSEPGFLLECMARHEDWAAVICLVGEGQEINRGEAGITGWLDALAATQTPWHAFVPPQLSDPDYGAERALDALERTNRLHVHSDLHLSTSMRSFRTEALSGFVRAVLDRDGASARHQLQSLEGAYPLALTRDLDTAKTWLRSKARGNERLGLLASSRAMRLRPHAIDVRVDVNPIHWFLGASDDVRSSDFLEDAATEFQVQGLEVDWACVTWDADLRFAPSSWSHHNFQGARWTAVHNADNRQFVLNTYRVLLTRARQGMVIFVPPGSGEDHTRLRSYYDGTFRFLSDVGIPVI